MILSFRYNLFYIIRLNKIKNNYAFVLFFLNLEEFCKSDA